MWIWIYLIDLILFEFLFLFLFIYYFIFFSSDSRHYVYKVFDNIFFVTVIFSMHQTTKIGDF
jgi:predicted membrane protein